MINTETEAGQIAALAQAADVEPTVIERKDGLTLIVRRDDTTLDQIRDPNYLNLEKPGRIVQAVTVQAVESLVDYANAFKTSSSCLFADIAANSITGVLDYHQADPVGDDHKADHKGHRVSMALPFSEEWKTWTAIDAKLMDQEAFALFLEENAPDVVAPSGADLLEVARDIHAVRKVDFRKAIRTQSGMERFEYCETTEAKTPGGLEIPTKFQLEIPVYFNEAPVTLFAFLRWRLVDTDLKIGVQLYRAEHVRQDEFKRIVMDAAKRTDLPSVFGKLNA